MAPRRSSEHRPSWWVLADAEGNEACLSTAIELILLIV